MWIDMSYEMTFHMAYIHIWDALNLLLKPHEILSYGSTGANLALVHDYERMQPTTRGNTRIV